MIDSKKTEKILVARSLPAGFCSQVEVVAAYVKVKDKFLALQRNGSEKGCWGVPAGKVELGEELCEAMRRELSEETGIEIADQAHLTYLGKLFIRKPEIDYVYHMYNLRLDEQPAVCINSEHQSYGWFNRQEIAQLPLMLGAREAFDHYANFTSNRAKQRANVNAHLILLHGDQVLLHLRKNSGYFDDWYGLLSGHVEDGESAIEALIRETYEESSISIQRQHVRFVHCLHRSSDRQNVDLFFVCEKWEGQIHNCEIEKCADLRFFPLHSLPENTVAYIRDVLTAVAKGEYYSELGWRGCHDLA